MQDETPAKQSRIGKYKAQIGYQAQLISQLQEQLEDERQQFGAFVRQLKFGAASTEETSNGQAQRSPSPRMEALRAQYTLKRQVVDQQEEIEVLRSRLHEVELGASESDDLENELKLSQSRLEKQYEESEDLARKLAEIEAANEKSSALMESEVLKVENEEAELEAGLSEWRNRAELEQEHRIELEKRFISLKQVNLELAQQLQKCDEEIRRRSAVERGDLEEGQELSYQWQQELQSRQERIQALESDLETVSNELAVEKARNDEIYQELADSHSELQLLQEQLVEHQGEREEADIDANRNVFESFFKERSEIANEKDKVIEILEEQVYTLEQTNGQLRNDVNRLQTDVLQSRQARETELNDSMEFLVNNTRKPEIPRFNPPVIPGQVMPEEKTARFIGSLPAAIVREYASSRKSSVREDAKSIDKQISDLLEEKILPQSVSCCAESDRQDSDHQMGAKTGIQPVESSEQEASEKAEELEAESTKVEELDQPEELDNVSCSQNRSEPSVQPRKSAASQNQISEEMNTQEMALSEGESRQEDANEISKSIDKERGSGTSTNANEHWKNWERESLPTKEAESEEQRKPSCPTAERKSRQDASALEESGIARQEVEIVKDEADSIEEG